MKQAPSRGRRCRAAGLTARPAQGFCGFEKTNQRREGVKVYWASVQIHSVNEHHSASGGYVQIAEVDQWVKRVDWQSWKKRIDVSAHELEAQQQINECKSRPWVGHLELVCSPERPFSMLVALSRSDRPKPSAPRHLQFCQAGAARVEDVHTVRGNVDVRAQAVSPTGSLTNHRAGRAQE